MPLLMPTLLLVYTSYMVSQKIMCVSHLAKTGWNRGTSFDFWHGEGGNRETQVVTSKKNEQQ
jgi:hypothetical protein